MDISYEKTLTSLMFFNKVDTGEDYTVELEEIKTWTEEEKQLIASDLFDRAAEYTDRSGQYIDTLQELDFVDERYAVDLEWVLSYGNGIEVDNETAAQKIKELATGEAYEKSINEAFFWQKVAAIAIGCRDNTVLVPVIEKIESVQDKF